MTRSLSWLVLFAFILGAALPALAFASPVSAGAVSDAAVAVQEGSQEQEEQEEEQEQEEQRRRYEEVVVVTASRTEQLLLEAPTAMSVISSAEIETSPAQNYADLLRSVPGLNVSQTSARDVNLSSRSATSTLETSQLVLVDGRTVYQDFFGFVAWDLLPINFSEIEQIEVIRGPGSAVWGANAMTGVVNIITKSPRRLGNSTQLRVGGGEQSTGFASLLNSGVYGDTSYKASASYYSQDPWPRPQTIPGTGQPANIFPNRGTEQPKFDLRVDRILDERSYLSLSGGIAGSGGIIHTGIGPFNIRDGTNFWNLQGEYNRGAANIRAFVNVLDGDALNLLNGIEFFFDTKTFDVSAGNTSFFADGRHILTYGGNFRYQSFDLNIAPGEDNRQEGGAYIEDSITLTDHLTVNVGGRIDHFSVLDDPVFSPRVSVQVRPDPAADHVIRGSYARAFRAPSMVNNFLNAVIFNQVDLAAVTGIPFLPRFVFPSFARGNPDLTETKLDQFEIGYRGVWADRVALDFAYYRSKIEDSIDFFPATFYSPLNPPAGWPLPNVLLALIPLPRTFSYRNIGEIDNQGFEVGVQARLDDTNELTANYSWQDEPDPTGVALSELNIPAENRFNVGLNGRYEDFLYSVSVNYIGEAQWRDVLDARFHGPTEDFTTVNFTAGYRFLDGAAEASIRATNVTDQDFQQHVFGDIIGRRVLAEFAFYIR